MRPTKGTIFWIALTALVVRKYDEISFLSSNFRLDGIDGNLRGKVSSSYDDDTSSSYDDDTSSSSSSSSSNIRNTRTCVDGTEATCELFPKLSSLEQEINDFMKAYPNTPGARFITLLREEIHGEDPSWERERIDACYKNRDLVKCVVGRKNYMAASEEQIKSQKVHLPFYQDKDGDEGTAYELFHFQDTDKMIDNLGTHYVCLALILAGSTVSGAVIEMGPFAGFSSKCIAYGLKATGGDAKPMLVYDKYEDIENYNRLIRTCPWMKEKYPDFTPEKADFLPLWKDTVQYVYPQATPVKGYFYPTTLYDGLELLNGNNVDLFVIDSAKSAKALHDHMGSITLQTGTVIALMDFGFASQEIFQIYGCFREFMFPVFTTFIEQNIWVVKKTFSLDQPSFRKCYKNISNEWDKALDVMNKQFIADHTFMAGLTSDEVVHEKFTYWVDRINSVAPSADNANANKMKGLFASLGSQPRDEVAT